MTTLKDLSRHLGLSVTQVSRALNDHSDVAEETKRRVRDAATALDYQPNLSARRLRAGRSGLVGVVLPEVPRGIESSMFMNMFGGMSAHFWRHRMQFVTHIADPAEDIVTTYRRLIQAGSLDGFVIAEPVVDDPRVDFLLEHGVPFVLHGRGAEAAGHPYFDIDNHGVGVLLTKHLISKGHKRIALLNGLARRTYVQARFEGYVEAHEEAGLPVDPALHRCADMTEARGLVETVWLFKDPATAPTAIIAGHPLIAKGVYRGLESLGLKVPADVSVVVHDDILPEVPLASLNPMPTCTRAALNDSWEPLAEFLVGAIEGRPIETLQEIEPVDFVEQGSVGPPATPSGSGD